MNEHQDGLRAQKSVKGDLAFVAGLFLLVPAYLGMFATGGPTLVSPLPVLTVIPAFFGLSYAALGVPVLCFFLWNPGLLRGHARVPRRSYWLLATVITLNVPWFVFGWNYGLQFQGSRYTHLVSLINVLCASALAAIFALNRKREPSFKANLVLHWLLFAWLAWYAFPYLGELP